MSIPRYQRKSNPAIYVEKTRKAYIMTIDMIRKVHGKYKTEITDRMLIEAQIMYTYAIKADGIFMSKKNRHFTFFDRQRYTRRALVAAQALSSLFTIYYEIISKGDQSYGKAKKRDEVFTRWGASIEESIVYLKKILNSNKDRYDKWEKEVKEYRKKRKKDAPVSESIEGFPRYYELAYKGVITSL